LFPKEPPLCGEEKMNLGIERYVTQIRSEISNNFPNYYVLDSYRGLLYINKFDPHDIEFIENEICTYLLSKSWEYKLNKNK